MSKIDQLLAELCPDGVEYRQVKDVFDRLKGTPITAAKMKEIGSPDGDVRVFAGGKTRILAHESDIPNANITRVPAVLVQSRGVIDFVYCDHPFTFKNEMWAYTEANAVSVKFLYYVLRANAEHFRKLAAGKGSMPQISLGATDRFEIPVPPIPVQEEVVRILDSFTELEAELEAELEVRRAQYAYYRDQLLSFDSVNIKRERVVSWLSLGDLGSLFGGLTGKTKRDFGVGGSRYVTYVNVYNNASVDVALLDNVSVGPSERQNAVRKGDVLFTASSENPEDAGMSSVVLEDLGDGVYLNSFCFGWRPNAGAELLPGYLKYVFRSAKVRAQIERTANGVTRYNVSKEKFKRVKIPVPSLETQRRVVEFLDRFDELTTSLTEGLPAEIEARRQQYEHYRDRLLDFPRKEAC